MTTNSNELIKRLSCTSKLMPMKNIGTNRVQLSGMKSRPIILSAPAPLTVTLVKNVFMVLSKLIPLVNVVTAR